jgi:protein TonB
VIRPLPIVVSIAIHAAAVGMISATMPSGTPPVGEVALDIAIVVVESPIEPHPTIVEGDVAPVPPVSIEPAIAPTMAVETPAAVSRPPEPRRPRGEAPVRRSAPAPERPSPPSEPAAAVAVLDPSAEPQPEGGPNPAHMPPPLGGPSPPSPTEGLQAALPATPPAVEASYADLALGNAAPVYPVAARVRGMEGRVVLEVEVRPDGYAAAVTLKRSSGWSVLDQAAHEAVRRWRFHPAQRDGAAVAGRVEVPIVFRLTEPAAGR